MTNGESNQTTTANGTGAENLAFGDVVSSAKAPVLDTVPFGMLNYRIPEFDYQKYPLTPMPFDNFVKVDNYHLGAFNGYYGLPGDFDVGRRNEHFANLSGNSTVDGDSIAEEDEPLGPDGSIPPPNKRDPIYTAVSGLKWKAKSKKWVVRWDNPNTNRRVYKYFSGTRYGFLGAHKRAKYYLEFLNASVGKCEAPSINNPFCRRTEGPPKGKTNKGLLKRLETKRGNNISNFGNGNGNANGFGGLVIGGPMNNQHHRCGTLPMEPYVHYYYSQDVNGNGNVYNGHFNSNGNVAIPSRFNQMMDANGDININGNANEYAPITAVDSGSSVSSTSNGGNVNGNNININGISNNPQAYYGNSRNTAWVLESANQQKEKQENQRQCDYFGCT